MAGAPGSDGENEEKGESSATRASSFKDLFLDFIRSFFRSSILCQIGLMTSTAIMKSQQLPTSSSTACLLLPVTGKKTMSSAVDA